MPASSARWMMRIDSSWSWVPHAPNIIAPRHRGLTLMPVRPRVRYSMVVSLVRTVRSSSPSGAAESTGTARPGSGAETGAGVGGGPQEGRVTAATERPQRGLRQLDGVFVPTVDSALDQLALRACPLGRRRAVPVDVVGHV